MGDVIYMAAWRRSQQADSKCNNDEHSIQTRLRDWGKSHGISQAEAVENRLLREKRDQHGLEAMGRLASLGNFPPELDEALRTSARARHLTVEELLETLLEELQYSQ
jgi:hypothetical protein